MTYVYADQTAVLGPLATYAEPHIYDLCAKHAERLSAPRGWQVVRLGGSYAPARPSEDDLLALADAVREAGRPLRRALPPDQLAEPQEAMTSRRRGHLRVLPDP